MIQRSPTYVVSGPSKDAINRFLEKLSKELHILIRWKNILYQSFTFLCKKIS